MRGLKQLKKLDNGQALLVAPYVGAWIETAIAGVVGGVKSSHPTWVRGLKHNAVASGYALGKSHPTWVRGLKQPLRV